MHVLGDSEIRLWGLDATTRLQRQLGPITQLRWLNNLNEVGPNDSVLLVRGDYLFEARTLNALIDAGRGVLRCAADEGLAAALVDGAAVPSAMNALESGDPGDFAVIEQADAATFDGQLRKAEPPILEPISAARRDALEAKLYGNAYKGVTDLVTKWWWPRPAKIVVGWCAAAGITPNAVTLTGLVLMLFACWAFWTGHYAAGLIAGWIMTFLDTVDGKLARVTIQSSRIGHVLDHGMDIVHPPFWYLFWGLSLAATMPASAPWFGWSVATWCWLIFGGYVAGRLIEGAFHALGDCSLFAWQPFDAYNRLITARRNPCMIILTLCWAVGRPDWGFYLVALWTLISSGVILVRLAQAAVERLRSGPVQSWLADPERARAEHPEAFARFSGTRSAYGAAAGDLPQG
ncbi:MAG: CDP-alcohol phosphatidyltransferase family protein [Pseudomonadota bacterium]